MTKPLKLLSSPTRSRASHIELMMLSRRGRKDKLASKSLQLKAVAAMAVLNEEFKDSKGKLELCYWRWKEG